jgi:hypothetical protein
MNFSVRCGDYPPVAWLVNPFCNAKTLLFGAAVMFGTDFHAPVNRQS